VNFVAMAMATWSCSGASSRCYSTASSQRYNATARVAATLRRCCNTRRDNAAAAHVAAALLQQALQQRYNATLVHIVVTAGRATLLCSDGRWLAPKFLFLFLFFFTRQFQRENESKTERKETGLRNMFPGSVGWLECNTKAPSRNNSSSNLRSFLALPPAATTPHQ